MDSNSLQTLLAGLPVPAARWMESTGSTNGDAAEWAGQGAPDGALVAADLQTAGRGRLGRTWVTRTGGALAFSLVLRPSPGEQAHLPLFSPLGGMAVADALAGLGLSPEIKWPNDVLLGRRKVCGILAEAIWLGSELQAVILGIGVNIAPSSVPPAGDLIFPAGCVEEFAGRNVERFTLLRAILGYMFERRKALGSTAFRSDWEARLAFRGEMVTLSPPGEPALRGIAAGLDGSGNLRIVLEDGSERTVAAGDLTLRPI
jgi:BirA family biotin operon repressor/biotin-[acetyl-CoA-carboxylase] ligase